MSRKRSAALKPADDSRRDVASGLMTPVLLAALAEVALAAGAVVLRHAGERVALKRDGSPATAADDAAEALILDALARLLPGLPVISEEASGRGDVPLTQGLFALVDPLDGTKEFVAGDPEFTVNLALVEHGRPLAGVIFAPALNRLWLAGNTIAMPAETMRVAPGESLASATDRRRIAVRRRGTLLLPPVPDEGLVAVASRWHCTARTEDFLGRLTITDRRSAGSSLKFCLVAEGLADVYPRFGPTMEWDTAAGQAVLTAAGGEVRTIDGATLTYGKREAGFQNPEFIATSDFAAVAHACG